MNILYVCTYNEVRSAGAEVITNVNANLMGIELRVSSAGFKRGNGQTKPEMNRALFDTDIKYDKMKGTPEVLDPEILQAQDLIFCFTYHQKKALLNMNPGLEGKVFVVPEYLGEQCEIRDPDERVKSYGPLYYLLPGRIMNWILSVNGTIDCRDAGGVQQAYNETARQIEKYVKRIIEKMISDGLLRRTNEKNVMPSPLEAIDAALARD